jgi:GT2 family glycosyltransferase
MTWGLDERPRPPAPGCALTVCIPARNEAAVIEPTLAALAAQRTVDGRPLAPGTFDVIVFANNCTDTTVDVIRAFAARTPNLTIQTMAGILPAEAAHIGTARRFVLDRAAARFLAAGRPDGIVASIDSDTLPGESWAAWMMREMHGRDAVAGHVTLAPADQARLLAPVRLLYARELTYRRVLAHLEARIDPRPEDPFPRHGSFVGASFAVTARAYVAAGGLPPLPRLEDFAFCRALHRIDARIRYSLNVRAATSARLDARVSGGFGTFITELHACARRGVSFTVEHPQQTIDELASRAALRRLHRGGARQTDVETIASVFRLAAATWLPLLDSSAPLGIWYERIAAAGAATRPVFEAVPVEVATDALRAAADRAALPNLESESAGDEALAVSLDAG